MAGHVGNRIHVVPSSPESTLIRGDNLTGVPDTSNLKPGFIRLFFSNLWKQRAPIMLGLVMVIVGTGTLFLDMVALGIPGIFTAHITCGLFFIGGTLITKAFYDSASAALTQHRLDEHDSDAIFFDPDSLPTLPRNPMPAFEDSGTPARIPQQDAQ